MEITDISSVSLCFIALCLIIVIWWNMRWRKLNKSPPMFPGALPILGHSLQLLMHGRDIWLYIRHVMLFALNNGQEACTVVCGQFTVHVLTNPDECYTIANACNEKSDGYKFAKEWIGEGLITGSVPVWKRHRKLLNQSLNQQVLEGFIGAFNVESKKLANLFKEKAGKAAFDHLPNVQNWAIRTTYSTLIGLRGNENSSSLRNEYIEAFHTILECMTERVQKFWLHSDNVFKCSSLKRRQDEVLAKLNKLSNKIIAEKEIDMQNKMNDISSNKKTTFKSYLEFLLDLKIKNIFTNKEVIEEMNTIIAAGYDTTSITITQILVVVGSHPDVQDKIYKELQEIFGGVDRDVTKEDLSQMKYLEAVIKESIRLYPVIPIVFRHIDKDIRIRDYTLPAGDDFVIPIYALNRHSVWGPDVEVFRPERWLDPSTLPEKPYAYAAFNVGRRNCIGKNYAMMSMKTVMAHILRLYKITADISKVKYELLITLIPVSGHHIQIDKRQDI